MWQKFQVYRASSTSSANISLVARLLFVEGRIYMSLTPVRLALKLPPETKERLLADNQAEPLRYFPNGPIKKDYALFPGGEVESDESFGQLALESIQYALSLPKPKIKLKAR